MLVSKNQQRVEAAVETFQDPIWYKYKLGLAILNKLLVSGTN